MDRKAPHIKKIYIEWVDPHSIDEWSDEKEVKHTKVCKCYSFGFFVSEDKDVVKLALNMSPNEDGTNSWSCIMSIPHVCITKRKFIK